MRLGRWVIGKHCWRPTDAVPGFGGPAYSKETVMFVPINKIKIPDRDVHPDSLALMCDSLITIGQCLCITVRREGRKYKLIDGLLRLKAAKQLGWSEIEAIIQ